MELTKFSGSQTFSPRVAISPFSTYSSPPKLRHNRVQRTNLSRIEIFDLSIIRAKFSISDTYLRASQCGFRYFFGGLVWPKKLKLCLEMVKWRQHLFGESLMIKYYYPSTFELIIHVELILPIPELYAMKA